MKKTYEKPVLTTEVFAAEDVITVSSPNAADPYGAGNSFWEIGDIPTDVVFY